MAMKPSMTWSAAGVFTSLRVVTGFPLMTWYVLGGRRERCRKRRRLSWTWAVEWAQ